MKMNNYNVSNWINIANFVVGILGLIFGGGLLFNDEMRRYFLGKNDVEIIENLARNQNLTYSEVFYILDNDLFIKRELAELHFGGKNFDLVKFNCNVISQGEVQPKFDYSQNIAIIDGKNKLCIEFNYKSKNYQLLLKNISTEYSISLNEIKKPSMKLNKSI
jgi:hypothetical protein